MSSQALTSIDLKGILPLTASGKVREIYTIDSKTLLFIATDRISAFDVVLSNGIPSKGRLLTLLTKHWFSILSAAIPNLKTHFLTLDLPSTIQDPTLKSHLQGRSMQVRALKILPIEAIVRGYITGSAWQEYTKSGTVHGEPMPAGLHESSPFPNGAIYTPSTKAPAGQKDENISRATAATLLGSVIAARVEELSLQLYTAAAAHAAERGIIIADTKFEFGLDAESDEVVLVDEVLTPDSSRFWDRDAYSVGKGVESFDKQFLRDWLVGEGLKGRQGVVIPEHVVRRTEEQYREVYRRIVGVEYVDADG